MISQQSREIIEVCRILYQKDFIRGIDGNVSVRLPDGNLLITPTGKRKETVQPKDLLTLGMDGQVVVGTGKPSSEYRMHIECYRAREEVSAIIHAHPAYSVSVGSAISPKHLEPFNEAQAILGGVARAENLPSGSRELGEAVASAAAKANVVVIKWHGVTVLGTDLSSALTRLETFDWCCKVIHLSRG